MVEELYSAAGSLRCTRRGEVIHLSFDALAGHEHFGPCLRAVLTGVRTGVKFVIVDVHDARGTPSPDDQSFMESTFFPGVETAGLKAFVVLKPKSAITSLGVSAWAQFSHGRRFTFVQAESLVEAQAWVTSAAGGSPGRSTILSTGHSRTSSSGVAARSDRMRGEHSSLSARSAVRPPSPSLRISGIPSPRPAAAQVRVLLAYSDAAETTVLREGLRRAGHDVRVAYTGPECIEMTRRTPDVIVLDAELDDFSGIDLLGKLSCDPATEHIPVVLIEGRSAVAPSAAELGAVACLKRPVSLGELRRALAVALKTAA